MAAVDELKGGEAPRAQPHEEPEDAPAVKGKPRRRHIFGRGSKAGVEEGSHKHRVVLEINEFGRVTEELEVKDPVAATHWDVRLWRRLR